MRACVSYTLAHKPRETRTHVRVSTRGQAEICAENQGAERQGRVSGKAVGANSEPVEFLSSPTGHTAKYIRTTSVPCRARFSILCMYKQKQQCLWPCLHSISVLASLILNWISLAFFPYMLRQTKHCETFCFCIEKCTVLYFRLSKEKSPSQKKFHDWWFCAQSCSCQHFKRDCLHTLTDRHLFGFLAVSSHWRQ